MDPEAYDTLPLNTNQNEYANYSSLALIESQPINKKSEDIHESEIYNISSLYKECINTSLICFPIILATFLEFLNPFITAYSVGWLGKNELASSALSAMFANMTGWSLAFGMTSSLDTLCSQAYTGSEDITKVGLYAQRGFFATMCLFFPISFTWFHAEAILLYLNMDPTLSKLCGIYLRYLLIAMPSNIGFECVKKFLQAQGIMKASAVILMLNLPICILSNYLLVWYPPTRLGFIGAPIALSITSWSCFIMSILYVCFIDGSKAWGGFTIKAFSEWRQIFKLGIPGVIMTCSEWWAYEIMAFNASYLGNTSLAAHGSLANMSGLFYQVANGVGTVTSNLVGNALGEGHPNRSKKIAVICLLVGTFYAVFVCGFILIFIPYLKRFNIDDPEVVSLVSATLPVIAITQFGDIISDADIGILRGMGRQDIAAKLNLSIFYLVGIPTGFILAFYFKLGVTGLWIGFCTGSALIAIITVVIILKSDWKQETINARLRLIENN